MGITKSFFDYTKNNEKVYSLLLENKNGVQVELITFGAAIRSIIVKDKNNADTDIIIGHDKLSGYEEISYHGATIGRFANRIANGKFSIDEKEYTLPKNNGVNSLHGGLIGYNMVNWEISEITDTDEPSVTLSHTDPDNNEGYPGEVKVNVTFTLSADNALKINYRATPSEKTIINLTNHSYFNLNGYNSGKITEQFVKIDADCFTPINENLIPTGELKNVENTPFDFREHKTVGQDVEKDDENLKFAGGYDHNFVFNKHSLTDEVINTYSVDSGIEMSVYTDMPGVQFYIGNFLDGTQTGKDGKPIEYRTGFCFETQYFPDTVNQPNFPQCTFDKDEEYNHTTVFKFGLRQE